MAEVLMNGDGNAITHTPQGLVHIAKWGSLRHAAGSAGLLARYARTLQGEPTSKGSDPVDLTVFAEKQVSFYL